MILFWSTIIILNLAAILIPKTLPGWQLYATSIFAVMFQLTVDDYLDIKLDLYGYFNKGVDLLGIVYEYGIFPAVSILFLTGWVWVARKGLLFKAGYLVVCTLLATTYEFCALKSSFFYYNGWKLWYSAFQYPLLFLILVSNLRILQWLYRKSL
ncbi:MAG TPA: hypothetical protein VFK33_16780 [Bacillales bacterium]|nr:hypothetical protein [Bacillales bacterium]